MEYFDVVWFFVRYSATNVHCTVKCEIVFLLVLSNFSQNWTSAFRGLIQQLFIKAVHPNEKYSGSDKLQPIFILCKCWFHMNACIVFHWNVPLLCHALGKAATSRSLLYLWQTVFSQSARCLGASWPDNQHTYTKLLLSAVPRVLQKGTFVFVVRGRYKLLKLLSWLDGRDKINNPTVLSNPSCKGSK